jgi:hypothetical protein
VEPYVACDVDQIPVSDPRWSERTNSNGIEQVRELLVLINCKGSMESLWQQTSPFGGSSPANRGHTLNLSSERILMVPARCPRRMTRTKSSAGS